MSLSVTERENTECVFEAGTSWHITDDGYLNIGKEDGDVIATYAPGAWTAVKLAADA